MVLLSSWPRVVTAASDFQLWMQTGVNYNMTRKLRLDFDQYVRLDENASHVNLVAPQLAVRYRINRYFRIKGGFRFNVEPGQRKGASVIDTWYRFFFDAVASYRSRPVTFHYRLRLQEQFGWPENKDGVEFQHTIRNKVGLDLRAGKGFIPYVSGELFGRINDKDGFLHKWRATAGSAYRIGPHECSLYYRFEDWLNGADRMAHILGLSYHYSF